MLDVELGTQISSSFTSDDELSPPGTTLAEIGIITPVHDIYLDVDQSLPSAPVSPRPIVVLTSSQGISS